jgi:phage-related protein
MFFEKTSGNPLVDCHSDDISQATNSNFIIFVKFCLLDSFEEESSERLKGVLVHLINDLKLDEQEIEC